MKTALLVLLFPTLTFAHENLPLKHGYFVQQGTSCQKPPSSAVMGYYPTHIGVGHDFCDFKRTAGDRRQWRGLMTCKDRQTDKPGAPIETIITIVDRENFVVGTRLGKPYSRFTHDLYTYCGPKLEY